jgi:Na+-driven multidrug efflux pump
LFISLPVAWLCGFYFKLGICGLLIGYGSSALILGLIYSFVVFFLVDWVKTAEIASLSETNDQNNATYQHEPLNKSNIES